MSANEPFAISALIIILGYTLKRIGILEETAGDSLAKIALNVTLPAVILTNVPTFPIRGGTSAILPFFGLAGSLLMISTGYLMHRKRNRTDFGLQQLSLSGYNIGLFAVPMVMGLYGNEGVTRFLLLDVGNAFAVFGIGYYLAALYSPLRNGDSFRPIQIVKMLAKSIPFVAYIIAIIMNLAGWRFDGFFRHVLDVPVAMNRGVSLLAVGVLLRFRLPKGTWKSIKPSLLIRYAAGILGGAAALFALPLPPADRIAVAGVLIMPIGLSIIPFSLKWGYDRNRAADILNVEIPISFILFWAVWMAGRHLLP